ncbi:MAG TPA: alpha/beta hydrolase [Gemmatimonadales bacterium]|nr:alpha/beta hydrolase [Gemmatimonadales bacterium]
MYLDGGPGGNTIASLRYTLPAFEPFLEGHDLVFFDQRGVGSSSPSLECQGLRPLFYSVLGENLSTEEYRRRILEEAEDCREDLLARGADLRAYNSAENAADVEDLRRLLGYETWNLFGISYGTRLALTVMRDYPNGLRSVVLDSVYPLQVNLFTEGLDNVARVLRLLFDSCSADPACAAAYPDLESVFYQEADALERQPVDVPLRDPLSARYQLAQFDGEALLDTVVRGLHAAPVIPLLPRLIYDVRRGNFELAALIASTTLSESDLLSIGAYLSIECNDEAPFSRVKDASASVARHPELTRYGPAQDATLVLDVCRAWMGTDTPVDPLGNTPVVSAVPTLIFAGGYDPVTPPAWAQAAAAGLENSHYVEFPDAGHGIALSSPCSAGIVVRFWEDPAAAPDSSCVSSTGPTFAGPSR